MPRKITQIACTGVENTQATLCNMILAALCDDGTVWITNEYGREWWAVVDVTQPESSGEPKIPAWEQSEIIAKMGDRDKVGPDI